MSWRPRWYLKSVEYTVTATGVKIVAYTDVACHLTFRWTTQKPRIHLDPVLKRGVPFRSMPRYCFTTYHDNEQEEAYDTYIHTYIKEPWQACETRWYYLFGTIDGVASPSESPLLHYHRKAPPKVMVFYPDLSPEVTSVDGWCRRYSPDKTWADIHDEVGTHSDHIDGTMTVEILPYNNTTWLEIARCILTFDTSELLPTYQILGATLKVRIYYLRNDLELDGALGLYASWPAVDNDIVKQDYGRIGAMLLAPAIPYPDLHEAEWSTFTLNADGLSRIMKGSITRFALREANYDAPNIEPTPVWNKYFIIRPNTADYYYGLYPPTLSVTYKE